MARKGLERLKRTSYVSRFQQDSSKFTPSDEVDIQPLKKKVRKEFSVWNLKKESEYFEQDTDHIYSRMGKDGVTSRNKEFQRLSSHSYMTRSNNLRKKPADYEIIEDNDDRDSVSPPPQRKSCTKNALMARLNRERKKLYISTLEDKNKDLLQENIQVKEKMLKQEKVIAALRHEVSYLKSLFANSKEITEILRSLKCSTGLPVSSSLRCSDDMENERCKSEICNVAQHEETTRQPKVKKVTSGTNFPILQEDVNLGFFDSNWIDGVFHNHVTEETSPQSEFSLDDIFLNEIDLNSSMFDCVFDPKINYETEDCKAHEDINASFPDIKNIDSNVGLCLHVNKRKVSVELCSLCNSLAQK